MEEIELKKFFLIEDKLIAQNCTYPIDFYKNNDENIIIKKDDEYIDLYYFDILKIFKNKYTIKLKNYLHYEKKLRNLFFIKKTLKNIKVILKTEIKKKEISELKILLDILINHFNNNSFTLKDLFFYLDSECNIQSQGLNTMLYSLFFSSKIKYEERSMKDLALTALLHNIGKHKINNFKYNEKLTYKKEKEYKKYPFYSFKLLQQELTNKKVLNSIYKHCENLDGSGFPNQLKSRAIPSFSRIVKISSLLSLHTNLEKGQKLNYFQCFELIKKDYSKKIDLNILNNFESILMDNY